MENRIKGKQLEYIKTQAKVIFGMVIVMALLICFWGWFICEIITFKKNYSELWIWKGKVDHFIQQSSEE